MTAIAAAQDEAIEAINVAIVRAYESRTLSRAAIEKTVADALREVENEGVDYLANSQRSPA